MEICGNECEEISTTSSQIVCATPSNANAGNGNVACDVNVTDSVASNVVSLNDGYTYTGTAQVNSVNPARGGTAGGNRITISGSGFG